jgi:hypothetical protein
VTDLFAYRDGLPGHYDVETSIEGAVHIKDAAPVLRDKVLRAVIEAGAQGITVLELCERDSLDRMAVQPRFSELRKAGEIADGGARRRNPSGVRAICWVLPQFVPPPPQRGEA